VTNNILKQFWIQIATIKNSTLLYYLYQIDFKKKRERKRLNIGTSRELWLQTVELEQRHGKHSPLEAYTANFRSWKIMS